MASSMTQSSLFVGQLSVNSFHTESITRLNPSLLPRKVHTWPWQAFWQTRSWLFPFHPWWPWQLDPDSFPTPRRSVHHEAVEPNSTGLPGVCSLPLQIQHTMKLEIGNTRGKFVPVLMLLYTRKYPPPIPIFKLGNFSPMILNRNRTILGEF